MTQGKSDRERRLAEALRANLRRRKGQARERVEGVDAPDFAGEAEALQDKSPDKD